MNDFNFLFVSDIHWNLKTNLNDLLIQLNLKHNVKLKIKSESLVLNWIWITVYGKLNLNWWKLQNNFSCWLWITANLKHICDIKIKFK